MWRHPIKQIARNDPCHGIKCAVPVVRKMYSNFGLQTKQWATSFLEKLAFDVDESVVAFLLEPPVMTVLRKWGGLGGNVCWRCGLPIALQGFISSEPILPGQKLRDRKKNPESKSASSRNGFCLSVKDRIRKNRSTDDADGR